MIPPTPGRAGRADLAALVAALLLSAGAALPDLLPRVAARKRVPGAGTPASPAEIAPGSAAAESALSRAGAARALLLASSFRPDPSRRFGPPPASASPALPRIERLDGKVVEGRLALHWTPAPGSRGTLLRVEGLGGPGSVERELPAGAAGLVLPVRGASGRIVVRASPLGEPGPEARVSLPYRIPAEVVRVADAHPATQSLLLVLRRAYDGGEVEGEFALHATDPVGGISPAGAAGPPVEFATDFVVVAVEGEEPGETLPVPEFDREGRVLRGPDGRALLRSPPPAEDSRRVVLRGLNDERVVLEVR